MAHPDSRERPAPSTHLACVDVPALPLQLLLRRHPDWRGQPAVVVAEDKPQALVLWSSRKALDARVLPGMRYAAALSLERTLRAGVIAAEEVDAALRQLVEVLLRFTPHVQPLQGSPGTFFLDASGLGRLFPSLDDWATQVRDALTALDLQAHVAVGTSAFGTLAVARCRCGVRVFPSPHAEQQMARRVPVERLGLPPTCRDTLIKLGVTTAGGFLDLPATSVRRRFGDDVWKLHRLGTGALSSPLVPVRLRDPVVETLRQDEPLTQGHELLFLVKQRLPALLRALRDHGEVLLVLSIHLTFDGIAGRRPPPLSVSLRPAEPTADDLVVLDLVRLRLETLDLAAGVVEVELRVQGQRPDARQEQLLGRPRRDPSSADRALARVRAELGDAAVVVARLVDRHLPEAQVRWEPLLRLPAARPGPRPALRRLVRRLFAQPVPRRPPRRTQEDGWLLGGVEPGPVMSLSAPDDVSGGWWDQPYERAYHYATMRRGDVLWVWRGTDGAWTQQGRVE